jgi:type II secretory pathway component PulF
MKFNHMLQFISNQWLLLLKNIPINANIRLRIYRMLVKMTDEPASLPIYDAITELRNNEIMHGYKSRLWYIYTAILDRMHNYGDSFATALIHYVPAQDVLILVSSEQHDITQGLKILIDNYTKIGKLRQEFLQALSYPIAMSLLLLLVVGYISIKIIPQFTQNIQPNSILSASSIILVDISKNFYLYLISIIIIVLIIIILILWALPNFNNYFRKYLEHIFPFNIYRIVTGCGFLFALNAMSKAGYIQYEALEQMLLLAKPYLKYRIQKIMHYMINGADIGQALITSNLNFPDKSILRELAIYLRYSHDDELDGLAQLLLDESLLKIKVHSYVLRVMITGCVFMVIAFFYFAIYQFATDLANIEYY